MEFRPIHTADLKTQICIVALLNQLMFDDTAAERRLSDISRLLPSNFYGNIPSTDVANIFKPWGKQYQEYSQKAIAAQRQYVASGKYKHEINLDIKKFYPSIDPMFIHDFILSRWPINYSTADLQCLKIILEKLLFFSLEIREDCLDLYYPEAALDDIKKNQLFFNVGLPQGLPQAYFFGNICMSLICKGIEREFEGDAYYYVDDSIIFTNAEVQGFYNNIDKLNESINQKIQTTINNPVPNQKVRKLSQLLDYRIFIHDKPNGKSTISEITRNFSLHFLAKPASSLSFEILASIDELEDSSLQKKTEAILSLIAYQLNKLNENGTDNAGDENTLKLLKRYKKFYTNRLNILKLREENEKGQEDIEKFIRHYGLIRPVNETEFFSKLEDDVFIVESKLLLKQLRAKRTLQKKLIQAVEQFEKEINAAKGTTHYFSEVLKHNVLYLEQDDIKYESLRSEAKRSIVSFEKVKKDKKIDFIKLMIRTLTFPDLKANESDALLKKSFGRLLTDYKHGYFEFVSQNVPDFTRRIVNAIISKALNVIINDSSSFVKQDNRAIYYYELRILMPIRSRSFSIPIFTQLTDRILKELKSQKRLIT